MQQIHAFLSTGAGKGAVAGFVAAAAVDYRAFKAWKSFHDLAIYDWRTAAFRWFQGIVSGALAGAGLDAVL